MSKRRSIEFFTTQRPVRHQPVQVRFELLIVTLLEQVNHLMDDDVFKAFRWLFRQLQVEPDAPRPVVNLFY